MIMAGGFQWQRLQGKDDGIDDVDDAVGGGDIGGDDVGGAGGDLAVGDDERELLAVDGGGLGGRDVGGEDFARDDVVGEDGDELGLVLGLEERLDGAGGKFGEGFVELLKRIDLAVNSPVFPALRAPAPWDEAGELMGQPDVPNEVTHSFRKFASGVLEESDDC